MLDDFDVRILEILQLDAGITVAEIADRVGLSKNPCWRRIRALEDSGHIRGRVAVLDRARMNVGQTVFVDIRAGRHSVDWLARFERAVEGIPEIIGAYRLSGDTDYLLHIVVPDIEAYDNVYKTSDFTLRIRSGFLQFRHGRAEGNQCAAAGLCGSPQTSGLNLSCIEFPAACHISVSGYGGGPSSLVSSARYRR